MGATVGTTKGKVKPTLNITPLVDVVLVLLIIFMVVTPLLYKQLWVHVPKKPEAAAPPPSPADDGPVMLTVDEAGVIRINAEVVDKADLSAKLARIMAPRSDKTVFFDASDKTPYALAVEALDLARSGGTATLAVVTERVAP